MKTNLIFKKQITVDGVVKTISRIIPVEVPFINSGEGWILSGHSDSIEVVSNEQVSIISKNIEPITITPRTGIGEVAEQEDVFTVPYTNASSKFQSSVNGTAKLVRSKGIIKIVARRGKTTYNQNTPNSVCINEFTKNEFFKNCRDFHGNVGCFEFKLSDGKPYDYWNNVIDKEYQRQLTQFLNTKTE